MIRTRTWVIIIAAILVVSLALCLWVFTGNSDGTVARIYKDGALMETIDLSAVKEPYSFTIDGESGSNTILVEPGRIRVSEADCPDQVCVNAGWLNGGAPIVCLPHRLVIELADDSESEFDTVSQ